MWDTRNTVTPFKKGQGDLLFTTIRYFPNLKDIESVFVFLMKTRNTDIKSENDSLVLKRENVKETVNKI